MQYNLGLTYSYTGDNQRAKIHLSKAIEINPNFGAAYNNLGAVLHKLGDLAEAIRVYEAGIHVDPSNPKSFNNLGLSKMKMGDVEKAAACYLRAIQMDRTYAEPYYNLGLLLMKLDLEKAKENFLQAVRYDPMKYQAHTNLSAIYYRQGELETAFEHAKKALAINPNFMPARTNYDTIKKELGR